ncbi:hypothetical protein [Streptomyces adonidis]|uniref:hypothetical protein n=1 Tax=Streptomyces adonidis TaxID=3231367 RepID=UPI0034DB32C2
MSQTSTPLPAPEVWEGPDQPPESASEPEALYRSFEAESPVPLRTGIGGPMPARPQAGVGLYAPSGPPGRSRRHVAAHVHSGAEALRRLAGRAVTGMEHPPYASPGQRAAEAEHGATTSGPAAAARTGAGRAAPRPRRLVVDSAYGPADESHMACPPLRPGHPSPLI